MQWRWRSVVNKLINIPNSVWIPFYCLFIYYQFTKKFTSILRSLPRFFFWCTPLDHDCHNSQTSVIQIPETDRALPMSQRMVGTPLRHAKIEFSRFLSHAIWPLCLWNFQQVLNSIRLHCRGNMLAFNILNCWKQGVTSMKTFEIFILTDKVEENKILSSSK